MLEENQPIIYFNAPICESMFKLLYFKLKGSVQRQQRVQVQRTWGKATGKIRVDGPLE